MNPQFQHYLNLSKSFLVLRKFQECRQYAIRAREIDPNHSEVLEIIAITDILMLPESINGQPNYYAILNVPNYSDDQQVMLNNFKSLMELLRSNTRDYSRLANEAFMLVMRAFGVLANPSDKVRFDDELRNAVNDGRSVSMNPMGGEGGLESASFFDLMMMTGFGDGLETGGNSLNQTQMDRSNDGLLESMLNPTRLNDGLLESMLNSTRLNDGLLQSILNSSGMTRLDDGRGRSPNPTTIQTRLDDGAGSSSNPTPIQTRLENFSNPTRVIRLADGGWTLSSRTPMSSLGDGGASTCETIPIVAMKKGGNFLNQMEKIRLDDGSGASSSNPTKRTRLDDGSGATSSNPTRNTCSDTFWTRCPYCYHMYEFLKDYKGCSLRCPNEKCKREWQALPIIGPSPPPEVADKGEYICSDFSTLGTQGNYLLSPFFKKKDDVEYIEISSSDDEVEEVENERKEESLRAEDELVQTNVDEVNNNNVGVENTIENNDNVLANDDIFDLGNVLWPGEQANENYNNALPNDDFDMDNVLWPGEQANENNNNVWANDDFDMGNVLWGEQANENNDNIWANDDFDMGNVLWGEQTNENNDNVVANDMGNVLGGEQANENNNAEGNGNAGGENTQNNNDDELVMGEDLVALFQDGSDKGAQDLDALFR
ncbi:hypothetical protein T459_29330 [Capsicum annuum]|uniref:Uncharacterized protein n=1 Tax=Capsicum annuum TaxID=4072 RepID=A0A2G2Y581_CAPAN|nr:hypothetical protein T459_29330 [Capsicum annuum]